MHSSLSTVMEAPAETIFELARDVRRWAQLLPHYARSVTLGRHDGRALMQFVALRRFGSLPFPVTWRAICWSDGADPADLQLHFHHVRGVTRGMRVRWHIRPLDGEGPRCQVTIEHEFVRSLLMFDPDTIPGFVDRIFTVPIATRTLRQFKALAEGQGAAGDPRSPCSTNVST